MTYSNKILFISCNAHGHHYRRPCFREFAPSVFKYVTLVILLLVVVFINAARCRYIKNTSITLTSSAVLLVLLEVDTYIGYVL